jgi:hypothetical protein
MCGCFSYKDPASEQLKKVYFPIPHAQIPIVTSDGIKRVQWGRCMGEDEEFDVPQTGWARLNRLAAHKWNHYHLSRVRIPG